MSEYKELFKTVEVRLYNYKNLDIEIKSIELEIENVKNEFLGFESIGYGERSSETYNINKTVENEVIKREKELTRLNRLKVKKKIEKKKIENALTSLDEFEITFFNLLYRGKLRATIPNVSMKLHIDRSHGYRTRNRIVGKLINMLYPRESYKDLPLMNV